MYSAGTLCTGHCNIVHKVDIFSECRSSSFCIHMSDFFSLFFFGSTANGGPGDQIKDVQEPYILALRDYCEANSQPHRCEEVLSQLRELHTCTMLLLQSKLLYMPYLLNAIAGSSTEVPKTNWNRWRRGNPKAFHNASTSLKELHLFCVALLISVRSISQCLSGCTGKVLEMLDSRLVPSSVVVVLPTTNSWNWDDAILLGFFFFCPGWKEK